MDRARLRGCLANGMSLEQIGDAAGMHASTVGYWIRKHGLRALGADRFAGRGAPERAALEGLVASGATLNEIAAEIDRSIATVRYWLAKWGIERPRVTSRADPESAPELISRVCRRHGLTPFRLEGRGYYRCLQCRQERVAKWRRRVKQTLVEEAGGCCCLCGYDRCAAALQFHHIDPATKEFELSQEGVTRSLARARAEAAKCVLLCATCHAEVEAGYRPLPP
jgi:transposase